VIVKDYVLAGHRSDERKRNPQERELVMRSIVTALAFGIVVAAAASPSLAQSNHTGHVYVSSDRAAALRECNARADKFVEYNWGVTPIYVYRACMAEHHQPE
jgi:hypothetical protein